MGPSLLPSKGLAGQYVLRVQYGWRPLRGLTYASLSILYHRVLHGVLRVVSRALKVVRVLFFLYRVSGLSHLTSLGLPYVQLRCAYGRLGGHEFSATIQSSGSGSLVTGRGVARVVRGLLLPGALTSVVGFSHLLTRSYLCEVGLRHLVHREYFSYFRHFRAFRSYLLLYHSHATSALHPFRFRPGSALALSLAYGLRLFPLHLRFGRSKVVHVVSVRLSVTRLRSAIHRAVGRVTIVYCRGGDSAMESRVVFRPKGRLLVRVVHQLIRGGCVGISYGCLHGGRASLLSPKWDIGLLVPLHSPGLHRVALRLPTLHVYVLGYMKASVRPLQGYQVLQGGDGLRAVLAGGLPLVQRFLSHGRLRGD